MIGDAPQSPGDRGEGPDDESTDQGEVGRAASSRPAPSDRTWIHPAELPGRAALRTPASPPSPPRRWFVASLGAAASVLLLAGVALLVDTPSPAPARPVVTASATAVPGSLARASAALAELGASTSEGVTIATGEGVALTSRRQLTTTMAFVPGSTLEATTTDGQVVDAERVVTDATTGITVATFAHDVTAATAHVARPVAGDTITALDIPDGDASTTRSWQDAPLGEIGVLTTDQAATLGTVRDANDLTGTATSLLVDPSGDVIGVAAPGFATGAYLPGPMVAALSRQLEAARTFVHGELGITSMDARTTGALVVAVADDGPSRGVLSPGEVLTSLDGHRIVDAAALVDAVDVLAAGDRVSVTYEEAGTSHHARVTLAPGP